jgi:ABC-type nitrate/sulfonate/bicarbonate transport system substrate-binding protein
MPKAITRHQLRTRLLASLLGALFVATAASAQQKPKLRPLRIALPSHSVSATAVYVARSLGIFERYGFDPQILVLEPRAALAAMLTGDLDFYAAVGTVGRAALRGVPVRVVLVALNRSDLVLLASRDITGVEQLRGKALGGYTAQASVNVILTELLRVKGLRPDEYTILNVGTARAAALMNGNVPAAVVNGVEAARLVRKGFHVLARAGEFDLPSGGLGAAVAALESKRDVLRNTVRAVLEGIQIAATQKDRVLPIYMKQFALSEDEARFVYDNVDGAWALDGRPTANAQKLDAELTQRNMGLKEPAKPEQIYDYSLLEELKEK